MEYWLGNTTIDRFVLRALKQVPNSGCRPITALTQHLIHREGLVRKGQTYPDEDCVYLSLHRLMERGRVEKYVDLQTGGIRYQARVYYG